MTSKQLILDIIARDKTKQGFTSATKGASGLRKGLAGVASGIGAIGLTAFAKDSVSTFQSATKETLGLNRAVGGTVEQTSRLRFAAKMSGQDIDTFTKSMGLLDKNLVKAAQSGKGPVFESMKKMGVSFTDAQGKVKPLTETLPAMAEVFSKMENGPQKTALALQLFGRSGAGILPFLNKGKAGIEELMSQTDQYNQVIGQEQVDAFSKNLVAQRKFDAAMDGIKMTLGEDLLPAITPVIEGVGQLATAFGKLPQPAQTGVLGIAAASLAVSALSNVLGPATSLLGGFSSAATASGTAAAAGATGMGSFAAGGTLAVGALASIGSAFGTYKITEQFGSLGGVLSSSALMAGGPLNFLAIALGNSSKEAAEAAPRLEAIRGVLDTLASSGNTTALAGAMEQIRAELGDGFDEFLTTTSPQVQAAFKSISDASGGLDAALSKATRGFAWGSTKVSAYAKSVVDAGRAAGKTDQEIAGLLRTAGANGKQIRIALQADPKQLDASLAESRKKLNGLKQYKKPEISALTGQLNTLMRGAQAKVDGLKQRKKPAPRVDVERAAADVKAIQYLIDQIHGGNVTIDIQRVMHAPVGGESAPKLKKKKAGATGGDLDGRVLVGERGPEFVDLPPGAHVYTASESRGMGLFENYAKGKKGKKLTAKDKEWKKNTLKKLRKKKGGKWESSNTAGLREALAGARESASSSFLGSAGLISGYDPNALAEAQAEAQAAQEEINASAVGSSARASGMARLKAARQKIADAPTSITDWVRKRVAKLGRWTAALGRLAPIWGATPGGQQLLREIWEKGPDGGLELAEELERSPGSVQELLSGANQAAAYAGVAAEYNPDVMNAGAAYRGGQAADRNLVLTSIVQVEGIQVVKAIQKFKQSQGGRELGIG